MELEITREKVPRRSQSFVLSERRRLGYRKTPQEKDIIGDRSSSLRIDGLHPDPPPRRCISD